MGMRWTRSPCTVSVCPSSSGSVRASAPVAMALTGGRTAASRTRPSPWSAICQDADLEGIDVMVLYPTAGLGYTRLREHDYSIAFAQTYNDWIAEWCSVNPKRLKA